MKHLIKIFVSHCAYLVFILDTNYLVPRKYFILIFSKKLFFSLNKKRISNIFRGVFFFFFFLHLAAKFFLLNTDCIQ
jgi:hypothetical protein